MILGCGEKSIRFRPPLNITESEIDKGCLLYTSDAADERSSVDLGGRRIIKKKKKRKNRGIRDNDKKN